MVAALPNSAAQRIEITAASLLITLATAHSASQPLNLFVRPTPAVLSIAAVRRSACYPSVDPHQGALCLFGLGKCNTARTALSMLTYQVDFLDNDNKLCGTVELEENDDAAAIQHARRINIPAMGGRFEVWHGTRLVHAHRNPPT